MSLGVSGSNQELSQVANRNPDETPSTSNIPEAGSYPETSQPCNTSLSTSTPPLSSSYGTTTEPLIHHPSPFDHSSESDNSHTTSSSSSSSDSDESESDMFGPPRNHSVTSPPPRSKTRVPMISARLRLKEERRRVIRLCGEKLERIRDPDSDLRRSVCINNTYYRLQAEVRREKQGKHEQQLRQFQQLDQPRSITPLPSIDSMLNSNHHENDLEKIDRELSAISDSFDSNLEREKISIRPSEDVLRSYGYNNGLDMKYNNTMDSMNYNLTNPASNSLMNEGQLNMEYNKLSQTTSIDMSYNSGTYNEPEKVSNSNYDLTYENIKNVGFDIVKEDAEKVASSDFNLTYDNMKESRFDESNQINVYGSPKQITYSDINTPNGMYSEKDLGMYQKYSDDYALAENKNINCSNNIYQNNTSYEMEKQPFKEDSGSYLVEVTNQQNIDTSNSSPNKTVDYKDIYSIENQQKNCVEETEIDVCGTPYEFDQKIDLRQNDNNLFRETDDKVNIEYKSPHKVELSQTDGSAGAKEVDMQLFENKEVVQHDGLRKRTHEEVDDKLVQEVLSHLYSQQPATKPVTAIEDIEPEIKKFKLDECNLESNIIQTSNENAFDVQNTLKRKHLTNADASDKRLKVDNQLHNVMSNFDYLNKTAEKHAFTNNLENGKTDCEIKMEDIKSCMNTKCDNDIEKNTNSLQEQNENGTNLKSDFEIILDALRLGSPGTSAHQGGSNDENPTQDTQEQTTNNNKRNNKCLDSCGQAAILADISGSSFHGLITSLET
ncbi:uncharacterized protein PF11_0213-like [Ctenocephalides felis]|uniref:uncharacterized protein PF11_0213-like n=1 Tax=Ctenocephalides felis TaxID=7515 RepID=UPI000E6E5A6F|nr:uncharacterized protein PF11_0213-like [Ctenocephalides felis]